MNTHHQYNKHQPAISAYAPKSRNPLLQSQMKKIEHHSKTKKRMKWMIFYIILQYWDTPTLQSILHKFLSSKVWTTCIQKVETNEKIQSLLSSNFGVGCTTVLQYSTYIILKSLIYALQRTKLEKWNILPIPNFLHSFVDNYQQHRNRNSSRNIQSSSASSNEIITKSELHRHNLQINTILNYWFGQYTPEKSQKNLWMIASSSQELLHKIDLDITNKFTSTLISLSTNKNDLRSIWCGGSSGDDGAQNEFDFFGWRGKLAAIIVLDQMSRHIHRHYKSKKNTNNDSIVEVEEGVLPQQKTLDNLAFTIAQSIQQNHMQEIKCGMIPTPMLIFALMPYRHASTIQSVGYVQSHIEDMSKFNTIDVEHMIRRFRRATNRRMAVLQDDARRAGKDTFYRQNDNEDDDQLMNEYQTMNGTNSNKSSSSSSSRIFTNDDILEFQPFDSDMSDAKNHPIVKTVKNFLNARGIRCKNENNATGTGYIRDTPIIVSLSGGVDSMVIASVLSYLRKECGYHHLYLAAVHIDYGNRPESSAEANFVQEYALNYIHFDKCIVRRIDEVTRGETKRDEYEKVSRNVRYDLYKSTRAECIENCSKNHPNGDHLIENVGVMLGHHRGDLVENVISNSNKGCGPLDLSGMTDVSSNDGVTIYRPLLPLDKDDVYDYSHKYGVPYFKDTTPHWSTRGKLRNKLLPLLEEVYGDGCLNNLAKLAEESDEARELFNQSAIRPFMDLVQHYPLGIIFSTAPFKTQGTYFWKIVLRDLLHSVGLGMFSDKSIEAFLTRALADNVKQGWLQCRKDYAVYLLSDGRVIVFVSFFICLTIFHVINIYS